MYLNTVLKKKKKKMAKKYLKRCLSSLAIRGMQMITALRFHLTSVRMANVKTTIDNQYW